VSGGVSDLERVERGELRGEVRRNVWEGSVIK